MEKESALGSPGMIEFYQLRIKKIISFIVRQRLSYWFVLLYLVFEYLRPQNMYPSIDVLPWGVMILGGALTTAIWEGRLFKVRNWANLPINIFGLIVIVSSVFALSPSTAFADIKTFVIIFLVYYVITGVVDSEQKLFVFVLVFLLISLKLSQHVFRSWAFRGFAYDRFGAAAGQGWLANSGELAIQMCIGFAISVFLAGSLLRHTSYLKKACLILAPVTFVASVIACGSRGGFLGLAGVLLAAWIKGSRKIWGAVLLAALVIAIPFVMSERDMGRLSSMGGSSDHTALNRLERWQKGFAMANTSPLLGVGYNNWMVADKRMFGGTGAECHNIFIECMSELGYVGLIAFIFLIAATIRNNRETERIAGAQGDIILKNLAKSFNLALLAYLITGFFVTVLYYPFFWMNLTMTVSLNNVAKKKHATIQR